MARVNAEKRWRPPQVMGESDVVPWVEEFYSETGRWWGAAESVIGDRDQARVDSLRRLTGISSGTVLDLGSAYGNTAAAFALAGFAVTGVEISDRIRYSQQHLDRVRGTPNAGGLSFVRADFNEFTPQQRFDAVTYWNGFGVGSDADQRRLLTRIARDWLMPGGWIVLDVFNPVQWIGWAGEHSTRTAAPEHGYPYNLAEFTDYDPINSRFIDSWKRDDETREWTQSQRCYSPADLLLLIEPTGFELAGIELEGRAIDPTEGADHSHPIWRSHEYRVALCCTGARP
jgi:SAM-dependent methyltransferase